MSHLPRHVRSWLAAPLPHEVLDPLARLAAMDDVVAVAVMPDVHWAENVCVGVAVGTTHTLLPQAVGSDIGCGIATVQLSAHADVLADATAAAAVLQALQRVVPGHRHAARQELPAAALVPLSTAPLHKLRERDGAVQFATLGRGNHFLEVQADEEERLWLTVHSGSRSLGPAILAHHLAVHAGHRGLLALPDDSDAGRAYVDDMTAAIVFAQHGRMAMLRAAAAVFSEQFAAEPDWSTHVDCQHNHARREDHAGRQFWVHRKGAMPAARDAPGVVPGSMGTSTFQVTGRGNVDSLCSSSHGAGRAMPRGLARRRVPLRQFLRSMDGVWFDHRLADTLRDEAPAAYKDIGAVMRAQRELVRIVRKLRPVLAYKAG